MLTDEKRQEILSLHSSGSLYELSMAIERAVIEQMKRPAPCERFCEARAFDIEIRQLKAQIDSTGRSPQDYTIEHAEYLAASAEQLLNHLNECTNIDDGVIEPDEHYSDYTSGLRVAIHDFRKRRDRSSASPSRNQ